MEVLYDKYSLMVNGKRVFIKSGAFHYFRTPGEEMARDRFMKMKAGGYNTVDIYFNSQNDDIRFSANRFRPLRIGQDKTQ